MAWKSKVLPNKSIKLPSTTGNSLVLRMNYFNNPKIRVEFN